MSDRCLKFTESLPDFVAMQSKSHSPEMLLKIRHVPSCISLLLAAFICHNVVDRKYETVILPIYGVSTPFHISTIKVFIL